MLYKSKINKKYNIIDFLFLLYFCLTFSILYTFKNIIAIILIAIGLTKIILSGKIKVSFYVIWSLGFSFICLFSVLWSPVPSTSINIAKSFLEIAIIGYIFLSQKLDNQRIEFYINAIIIAGLCLVARILIEFPLSFWGISRLHNDNLNANSIGMLLMLSLFCAYHLYKMKNKKKYLIALALFSIIILFTGSRKAYFGIVMGIVFLWWLHIKRKSRKIMAIPIAIATVIVLIVLVMKIPYLYNLVGYRIEGFLNLLNHNGTVDESTIIRSHMTKVGWELFLEKPLFGSGVYSYASLSGFGDYSHNNYIELLTSVGLVGTLWYYSIYLYNISKIIKLIKIKDKQVYLFACFFAIQIFLEFAYVCWQSESVHIFIFISTGYIYYFFRNKNFIQNKVVLREVKNNEISI